MMFKRYFLLVLLNFPLLIFGQVDSGVVFERKSSWEQILSQARAENKNIMIDCYTTWCAPCKKMDKLVFGSKSVGDFFNQKFICIKVQMDTSKNDPSYIKDKYSEAKALNRKYQISAYPTVLFVDSEGRLLQKSVGYIDPNSLVSLGAEVLDSNKNYYVLLGRYKNGQRDIETMRYLAEMGIKLGDTGQSKAIGNDFFNSLTRADWFKKENIDLIAEFTKSSSDRGFNLFYKYADTINRIMENASFSQLIIHAIIDREIMFPAIEMSAKTKSAPKWNLLKSQVSHKYGEYYADRVILASKANWNQKMNNWKDYIKYHVLFIDKYFAFPKKPPPMGSIETLIWNNWAWEVFLYSTNVEELRIALKWSNYAVSMNPLANWMDTYANILYKLGEKDLALSWERVAVTLSPEDQTFKDNLKKMENRQPTWPTDL